GDTQESLARHRVKHRAGRLAGCHSAGGMLSRLAGLLTKLGETRRAGNQSIMRQRNMSSSNKIGRVLSDNVRQRLLWVKSGHQRAFRQCPLYPQKRTLLSATGMSALCHSRHQPPHSITSSARLMSVGDTWKPSGFAVFRLITSSSLVGCSIGKSEGRAPFKILSTNPAARRYKSG